MEKQEQVDQKYFFHLFQPGTHINIYTPVFQFEQNVIILKYIHGIKAVLCGRTKAC